MNVQITFHKFVIVKKQLLYSDKLRMIEIIMQLKNKKKQTIKTTDIYYTSQTFNIDMTMNG